jgi:hypothetical protein
MPQNLVLLTFINSTTSHLCICLSLIVNLDRERKRANEMGTGLWVAFWIAFFCFSVAHFRPVFWIGFCGFLILMRIKENQMSQNCWVAFWLSLSHIYPDLLFQIEEGLHFWLWILYICRFCITSAYEMPTAAFWTLIVLLMPASLGSTLGLFVQIAVVIFSSHLESHGIRLPGLSIKYWILVHRIIHQYRWMLSQPIPDESKPVQNWGLFT